MSALLTELGKKLAERWLTLLVLPGALFLATAGAAKTLGHTHALDVRRLTDRLEQVPASGGGARIALGLAAGLVAAAAVGLAAQAIGTLVQHGWLAADWPGWPAPVRRVAGWSTGRRHRRWTSSWQEYQRAREAAAEAYVAARLSGRPAPSVAGDLNNAYRQVVRCSLEEPARPSWAGDRIHAVAVRLERDRGLDLTVVWPYVWLVGPETMRNEVTAARAALDRACTLAGWGLLYLGIGVLWWPAIAVAVVTGLTGWYRARTATDAYARLVEAAVRLQASAVARELGADRAMDRDAGRALTRLLQAGRPTDG